MNKYKNPDWQQRQKPCDICDQQIGKSVSMQDTQNCVLSENPDPLFA
jgi:hypothetical protein